MATQLSASLLYERHRLSYPQIDRMLGTQHTDLYQKDILENFKLIREFIIVTDEFRKMDIPFIPIKGPLLSYRIYGDATVRRSHDLDILIDFKDVSKAFEYLERAGYRPDIELPKDKTGKQILHDHAKHTMFIHPQSRIVIELHWQLFEFWDHFELDFNALYQQLTTIQTFMNRTFHVLKNEYDLFYLLIHGSTHKWQRLKWLLDISDYLHNNTVDIEEVAQLAQKHKALRVFPLYNKIATRYLPNPKLIETKEKIAGLLVKTCIQNIENKDVVFNPRSFSEALRMTFSGYSYYLLLLPDTHNRIKFLNKMLVNVYDAKDIKTTNIILLFLYRPFGYLYRHISGVHRE
jgi:hypothetical protein